jgi:phosphonate transport system substrate-binding protein
MTYPLKQPEKKSAFGQGDVVPCRPGLNPAPLRFASFLAENAFEFYRQVVAYLGEVTGCSTELVANLPPDEQDLWVDQGQIQVVFTCGLPYVHKADCHPPLLRLLAAPVLAEPRYQDRPIYFSDIVVRAGSAYRRFEDLRGARFAYNEISSWSGYVLVCYHLHTLGESAAFFGEMVPSGSHATSLAWVADGLADAAAIDSVVLGMEIIQRPERVAAIRVIEQLGPSPMPPAAASTRLEARLYQALKQALLTMHADRRGQEILKGGGMRRFAPVGDHDYDSIRQVLRTLPELIL